MKNTFLILICHLVFFICCVKAQDKITIDTKNIKFSEFASKLKEEHNIDIYYKDAWTSNIQLSKFYCNQSLQDILTDILAETNTFFIVRDKLVILTNGINLNSAFYLKKQAVENEALHPKEYNYNQLQEQEYIIHNIGSSIGKKQVKLFGHISHYMSKVSLKSVEVYLSNMSRGVTTDSKGYYELDLEPGNYTFNFKFMGLQPTKRKINLRGDGRLDVQMMNEVKDIKEIRITAKADKVRRSSMGTEHIEMDEVQSLPTALGEPDIIKSTTMLPGVESSGEGSIGFNVRGGSSDQNLILLDNAPIYYPAHFFGFFSPFNSDMINQASLYKASVPTQFGGRISSTYDIHSHEKISDKINGNVGISPVSTKIYLDVPLVENKLSIINSFRFTYSDWLLKKIDSKELINSSASFYDLQGKVLFKPNNKNQIELSYYKSDDEFQLHSDTIYNFNNLIGSVNWRHRFSEKLKMVNTLYNTNFSYNMTIDDVATSAFNLKHKVQEVGGKSVWILEKNHATSYNFGVDIKHYQISPGEIKPISDLSLVAKDKIVLEKAIESAVFIGSKFDLNSSLILETGLRYSVYGNIGKKNELLYKNNMPSMYGILDTLSTSSSFRNIEHGPEIRSSINYSISPRSSIKASYNRSRQYIHLLSNTTSISPTDTWRLSDKYTKPQIGDQYSLGFYKNLNNPLAEFSIETYYKRIQNAKDYKNGAELYLNEFVETEVINGEGKSYGIELMFRKNTGRLKAVFSYSYSRSFLKSKEKTGEFSINNGEYYRAPFDKPHNLKSFLSFKLSRRFIVSTNLAYHTGRPATYPIAKYNMQGTTVLHFSKRNTYRLPDYFRMDLSILMEGNFKKKKTFHSSLALGVYNLTGNNNTYSVHFQSRNNEVIGYKTSIFSQAVPTVTYKIEF